MESSPCRKHNCHKCCIETEMLLIKSDIKRIRIETGIHPKDFVHQTEEGFWMLKNKSMICEETCFFLQIDGLCSIYRIRPDGCRFYPWIWDLESHRVIPDDFCPYNEEFEQEKEKNNQLELFILKLFGQI